MKRILFFITLFCVTIALNAQVYTEWVGLGDGYNWDDPYNWDREGVSETPQYGDSVVIEAEAVIYSGGGGESFESVELYGGANLLIQSDLYVIDFYMDDLSILSVELRSLSDYPKVLCDGYYIVEGDIELIFSNYVPQIGNTYQVIQGMEDTCFIPTVAFVPDIQAAGFEVTLAVQCQFDGILHTVTGINYTTAKYWTGAGDGFSWSDAANWNNNQLPDASSKVIINLSSGAFVSSTASSVYSISIGEGNTLSLTGVSLSVYSNIYNNDSGTIIWNGGIITRANSGVQAFIQNYGTINLNTPALKTLEGGFMIFNEGVINHNQGNLNINTGRIDNYFESIYNINADNIEIGYTVGTDHTLRFFYGSFLKKTAGNGISSINLTNFLASGFSNIISEQGTLAFGENISNTGILSGNGAFQMPSTYIEVGSIAPGASPGTLTFVGDLTTGTTANFNIEIDGPTAGVQYDQVIVTNAATLEGNINVTLGYAPANNASFEILKAATLNSCNFPSQIIVNYLGTDYTFDVVCNGTSLFLNSPGVLNVDNNEIVGVVVYPNPVSEHLYINTKNNLEGSWSLFNQLGQLVLSGKIENDTTKIVLDTLNEGLYIVKINDDNSDKMLIRKIIIMK